MISVALTVARHTRLFSFIDRHPSQITSPISDRNQKSQVFSNSKFNLSKYILVDALLILLGIADYQKWWLHRPRGGSYCLISDLRVSWAPSSCAISLAMLVGVPPSRGPPFALGDLATVNFWSFPSELQVLTNFRCLRFSLRLLFLRNSKVLPQRNNFPLQPYSLFFFWTQPEMLREERQPPATLGRTYHKRLNFSDSEKCLVLRLDFLRLQLLCAYHRK